MVQAVSLRFGGNLFRIDAVLVALAKNDGGNCSMTKHPNASEEAAKLTLLYEEYSSANVSAAVALRIGNRQQALKEDAQAVALMRQIREIQGDHASLHTPVTAPKLRLI